MEDVKIWVLVGAIGVMGVIIGFAARLISNAVIKRLDSIEKVLTRISIKLTENSGEIKNLQDKDVTTQNRLNDHAIRLRELEINIGKLLTNKR